MHIGFAAVLTKHLSGEETSIMLAPMKRVVIFVGDVEKCAGFFRDLFDLEPIESEDSPDVWLELDAGGCRLGFHKAYGPEGPIDTPTGGPGNPHKLVFRRRRSGDAGRARSPRSPDARGRDLRRPGGVRWLGPRRPSLSDIELKIAAGIPRCGLSGWCCSNSLAGAESIDPPTLNGYANQ